MKTHLKLAMASILMGAVVAFGQNETDVYRYSNTFNEGSARFEAMGGSFGALGAESGCARINPAGLGRYSQSSIGLSFSGTTVKSNSQFQQETADASRFSFKSPSFHLVIVNDVSTERQGFLFNQIGFGMTRIANFEKTVRYQGEQFESLLDAFCAAGNGVLPEELYYFAPFSTSLAYETYTIDPSGNGYVPRLTNGNQYHERTIATKGGISEYYFNFSGNYLGKLYLGGNIGIQTIRYDETINHKETLLDTTNVSLRSFDYRYHFNTKGSGLNAKIGFIYLPQENIRFGLAIHTKTFFGLKDSIDANMTAVHADGIKVVPEELIPVGGYKYRLSTPARAIASFAYIFGNKGCINADLEVLDYGKGRLRTTLDQNYASYDFIPENAAVVQRLQFAYNLRIGGEWVIQNQLFIRGGYGYFKKGDVALTYGKNYDQQVSIGMGYRYNQFMFDLSYRKLMQTSNYSAFSGSEAKIDLNTTALILSCSIKLL